MESDGEVVSDTYYGENTGNLNKEQEQVNSPNMVAPSSDPFNIYETLRNHKSEKDDQRCKMISYRTRLKAILGTKFHRVSEGSDELPSLNVQDLWFDYISSDALGNSGGILCMWDPNVFSKDYHIISDNFVAIAGTWIPSNSNLIIISIYAPQPRREKRLLWNYISSLITRWHGDSLVLGDFNEVRNADERRGSVFNRAGAADFNEFISNSGLIDINLEGYYFTWAHPSASKMSKLDRFLVSEGFLSIFPHCSAICLDRHLSDHRPILLRELNVDYGATPFRFYHSWLNFSGFDLMVSQTWNSLTFNDSNDMIRFKKKLQALKKYIREWIFVHKKKQMGRRDDISLKLTDIDKQIDQGNITDDTLLSRMNLMKELQDIKSADACDSLQKAKIKWAVEGDENSKFFHDFMYHVKIGGRINFSFPNRLHSDQADLLEVPISSDEIRIAVWACGENKSPGPDVLLAKGCNSSFIALIPKVLDPKGVNDYRLINLIGSLYKVITKILALRLSSVLDSLISEVQSAFLPNRQILDGPFVVNEVLSWCKLKRHLALIFKVDFAKAYDSVRWDFLDDVLSSFGFGSKWRSWILGSLSSGKASVLVNGSLTSDFQLTMFFKGVAISNSVTISHLFYADDAVFVGDWSESNLSSILNVLHCFSLTSGLKINVHKSQLLGVGVPPDIIEAAAHSLGCSVMKTPFKYLGVPVGVPAASSPIRLDFYFRELHVPQSCDLEEVWIGDQKLCNLFPYIFAMENDKTCTVAVKLLDSIERSLRRHVRGGVESQQLIQIHELISTSFLSNTEDRWLWSLNGSGLFRVSDIRILLDDSFLPKEVVATRWVKFLPIKINIFAWKVSLDRLPTRLNLAHRGVQLALSCFGYFSSYLSLVGFGCSPFGSYAEWLSCLRLKIRIRHSKKGWNGVYYVCAGGAFGTRKQLLFCFSEA
ncbi:RNA-directed DNA polymerase, eukaryota [Tanacetum coccineum]